MSGPSQQRSVRIALALVVGGLLSAVATGAQAVEVERNFAGSAQLDYLAVPTTIPGRIFTFDGFTTELAVKLAVDFTEHFSANVKICYGCHGFETDMAYVDIRAFDEVNLRVGRMNPAFGDFILRHDPANHRANSKPLPYDMGRMLRLREWNMSVLPAPYVDNGLELYGTHWFGDDVQLDFAAYVMSGFKGNNDALDFDFVQSRSGSLYYVDNNSEPAVGGRVALTVNFTDFISGTFGASGNYGHYDPAAELAYLILGADIYLRFDALTFRGEYLVRRTEYALGSNPETRFRYDFTDLDRNFFVKEGFYVEVEYPFADWFEAFFRFDGMRRQGNVPINSPLSAESAILRETLGFNFVLERGLRIKASVEYWDFSDFEDDLALHLGVTANF